MQPSLTSELHSFVIATKHVCTRTTMNPVLLAFGAGLGVSSVFFSRRNPAPRASASANGEVEAYEPPPWLPRDMAIPKRRIRLGHLPTPMHKWEVPQLRGLETELWIKRDDCSGVELSGNKVRKLEFLLAEAVASGCDCVITVGGIQSNHCRATAAAARRLGLTPHIVLRTARPNEDPGLRGNLLIDRMVGAEMHLVGVDEFDAKGGWQLVCELKERLEAEGRKPYAFPSGGSNDLGTWGYVHAISELESQLERREGPPRVERVYFACGSGGTAAGLALGMHLSGMARATELVGLTVDDTPDIFYDKIDGIWKQLGATADGTPSGAPLASRSLLRLEDCVGDGYAQATTDELAFITEVARGTGVVLDPVYSGKAARGMVADLAARPVGTALFIHTGGLLGLFDKVEQVAPLLEDSV